MNREKQRLAWEQWGNKCDQILRIHLDNDTYEIIQQAQDVPALALYMKGTNESLFGFSGAWKEYIAGLRVLYDGHVDVADYTSMEYIKDSIRKDHGKRPVRIDFMVDVSGKERRVHVEIIAAEDYDDSNPVVYMYFINEQDTVLNRTVSSAHHVRGQRRILIVDVENENRKQLEEILSEVYQIQCVSQAQEARAILKEEYSQIAMVLIAHNLPPAGRQALICSMKEERKYQDIPILVTIDVKGMNLKEFEQTEVDCLECGATDFLVQPYNDTIVKNRVKSIMRMRESTAMLNVLETDSMTGLLTKEFFFKKVEEYLKNHPQEDLVMWATDIIGLKVINEKYGIEMGDEIVKYLAINRNSYSGNVLSGRIEGDKFATLMEAKQLEEIRCVTQKHDMGIDFPIQNVVVKHGFYHIRKKTTMRPQGMYDRALLALQKIKDTYGVYSSEYDDVLRKDLLIQRQIAENAETALREHQFIVYYQPKFDLHAGRTNGAEALIRWIHPELGFMNPGIFIPIFEQNGFIRKLDWYVWEEVCQTLEDWQKSGKKMVPISVNVSRRDFEEENLAQKVIEIVDRHHIPHNYFHIEVTESAYSDNPARITSIIRQFHDYGFVIELDDFGAGYSSMTALSDLDLDIMKLDMSIIRKDNPMAERNVLELSMELARMMKLRTVAEGVETQSQMERVLSLGGDYIQGFYYSKPLPKNEFEQYLDNEH